MEVQKRRVVYLTDQEWKEVKRWADEQGLTASAFLRAAVKSLSVTPVVPDAIDKAIAGVDRREAQAQRDAILNRVNRGKKP